MREKFGEVNQMGRKYESEMARCVSERRTYVFDRRTRVVLATILSCAVMIAGAAAVLSIQASAAQGVPTEFEDLFEEGTNVDYLVLEEDESVGYTDAPLEDDDFIMKRASTLKMTEFSSPGNSPNVYTKFVYTMNVKLRDIAWIEDGVAGMMLAQLTVGGFGESAPSVVTAGVTVDGLEVSVEPGWYTTTFEDGTYTLELVLPHLLDDGDYVPHNMVTLFLMWKVPMQDWDGSASEIGFPEYQAPEIP